MKIYVWLTTKFEGYHNWPDAPVHLSFLRSTHRHIFHVKMLFEVSHSDRDIEFIETKWKVEDYIKNRWDSSQARPRTGVSCEMIAEDLLEHFDAFRVEISEDGENGAIVERG